MKKIAQLLHSGAPQDELERAVVNGVNRRFYGADVPEDVVDVRRSSGACATLPCVVFITMCFAFCLPQFCSRTNCTSSVRWSSHLVSTFFRVPPVLGSCDDVPFSVASSSSPASRGGGYLQMDAFDWAHQARTVVDHDLRD